VANVTIEIKVNPSNIQRLVNEQVERITQHQYRQLDNYLFHYFGLDPSHLARDECTLVSRRDDQRKVTVVEILDINGDTIQTLYVTDEQLSYVGSRLGRVAQSIFNLGLAATTTAGALTEFGRGAIDAALIAEEEIVRQRFRERAFGVYPDRGHGKREAQQNARALLLSCLTPTQQEELATKWYFAVTTKSGNTYRIQDRQIYNVTRLDKQGRPLENLCVGLAEDVPLEDNMLAQKLLLETDEDRFLEIANRDMSVLFQ
jgi:hypothetical protein